MRLLSPIVNRMIYPALGSLGYFHRRTLPASVVNVITYHGVLPAGYEIKYPPLDNTLVKMESFRSQLRLLKKHYSVISPDQFLSWLRNQEVLPEQAMLLTCDDGLLNQVSLMLPVLQEEGLKCLFFVTGSSLTNRAATGSEPREMLWYMELYLMLMEARAQDGPLLVRGVPIPAISPGREQREALWHELMRTLSRQSAQLRREFLEEAAAKFGLHPEWRTNLLDDPLLRERFQVIRLPELMQLVDAEMTIGAHTLSHPVLAEQPAELAKLEMAECRKALESALGRPVWAIAYPFGTPLSAADREFRMAEEAGYDCAFMNVGGSLSRANGGFALPRIHVTSEMSLAVYEAHVSGFHHAMRSRLRAEAGAEYPRQ